MISGRLKTGLLVLASAVLAVVPVLATTVKQVNLGELSAHAHRIFRGTVVQVRTGSVAVGGGELPTTIYRIRVDEDLKGDFPLIKGQKYLDLQMLGKIEPAGDGPLRRVSRIPGMPRLGAGKEYLLFTTRPGSLGLSTTVGLGQGCFHVTGGPGERSAVNEFGNIGLLEASAGDIDGDTDAVSIDATSAAEAAGSDPAAGPMAYEDLVRRIRAELSRDTRSAP